MVSLPCFPVFWKVHLSVEQAGEDQLFHPLTQDPREAPHRILLLPTVSSYVPTTALHPSRVIGRNMPNNGLNALNCALGDGYSGTFHAVYISPQF